MSERTCTVAGCARKHVAKGLCSGHYNRTRYTSAQRHPKGPVSCACCGTVVMKYRDGRFGERFCSLECRDFHKWGPKSCNLADKPTPKRAAPRSPAFVPHERECAWCGSTFTAASSVNVNCSTACKFKAKRMRRRGREAGAGGTYTWAEVMRIFLTFDRRCAYCEQPIAGQPDPDHVVPLSRGGSNSLTNILPCCHGCNADKRDLLLTEWNADRLRRGLEPRTVTWDTHDPRVRHLTSLVAA